jgi:hypothetical protein
MTRTSRTPGMRMVCLAAFAAVTTLAACRGKTTGALLSEEEYAAARNRGDQRGVRSVLSLTGGPVTPGPVPIRTVASAESLPKVGGDTSQVTLTPGGPPTPDADAAPIGRPAVVDAKVGDVNGRPIFASEILDTELGPRLEQKAHEEGMTRERWLDEARRLIGESLKRIVADELVEAEARAALKPEVRQGLRSWIQEQREEARREAGGARALLEQKLREQNKSVEQWERGRESEALIRNQIYGRVTKRAVVTWQEMKLFYDRHEKEFNPDPQAVFRQIRVPTSDAEGVRSVRSALERGDPFEVVAASDVNTFNRVDAGRVERPFDGEFIRAEFFGVRELNEAAHALTPGEWTREPVVYGAFTSWLKLESITRTARPLSDPDVQLDIIARLSEQKWREEFDRYLQHLMDRARFEGLPDMAERLVQIALDRYWPKG